MACRTASACEEIPPPSTCALTAYTCALSAFIRASVTTSTRSGVLKYSIGDLPFMMMESFSPAVIRTLAVEVLRRPTALMYIVFSGIVLRFYGQILHARSAKLIARDHAIYRFLNHFLDTFLSNHFLHTGEEETAWVSRISGLDLSFDPSFWEIKFPN